MPGKNANRSPGLPGFGNEHRFSFRSSLIPGSRRGSASPGFSVAPGTLFGSLGETDIALFVVGFFGPGQSLNPASGLFGDRLPPLMGMRLGSFGKMEHGRGANAGFGATAADMSPLPGGSHLDFAIFPGSSHFGPAFLGRLGINPLMFVVRRLGINPLMFVVR